MDKELESNKDKEQAKAFITLVENKLNAALVKFFVLTEKRIKFKKKIALIVIFNVDGTFKQLRDYK